MKVLVLGANGMLGNAVLRVMSAVGDWEVAGTVRDNRSISNLALAERARIIGPVDAKDYDAIACALKEVRPDVVINCVGLVKQRDEAHDIFAALTINSLLPHRLASLLELSGGRLIHVSTDCVFSGNKGEYKESDIPDSSDLYGRSKLLGEVEYPHTVTLRTSIIGHELSSRRSLVEWFLSQKGKCPGYLKAVFSGLPTVSLAEVIRDYVIPRTDLKGLYHVSAAPISKYDLLKLVSKEYAKDIEIIPDDSVVINRSLDSTRFREATGWRPEDWEVLVRRMHEFAQI